MVFGAKLRTVMSSIIRWRNGEILRTARIGLLTDVVLLVGSNNTEHLAA
jgi:hypothetical protein